MYACKFTYIYEARCQANFSLARCMPRDVWRQRRIICVYMNMHVSVYTQICIRSPLPPLFSSARLETFGTRGAYRAHCQACQKQYPRTGVGAAAREYATRDYRASWVSWFVTRPLIYLCVRGCVRVHVFDFVFGGATRDSPASWVNWFVTKKKCLIRYTSVDMPVCEGL